jgi:peptidyl-prolyl cis-trans isomerase D
MLERIREGIQGPWAIGIVSLIVVSFVFTGVGGYLSSSATTAVAVVNDKEITAASLDLAYQNERARLESQFGDAISDLFANESYLADFRQGVLERLVNEELIAQKAYDLGLRVGDEQIKETIVQLPEFQIAGQFNNEAYNATLMRAGYTPTEFAEYMRVQMTRQQLVQALNGSSFDVDTLVTELLKMREQTRDASILEISAENYLDDVELTEEDILAYYNENLSQYDTEEQVKLAYVSLSVDDLIGQVDVTDEEVQARYDEQVAFYTSAEQRSVSHILIEIEDDADAARAEAQALVTQLENGADFANLAEQNSDDLLSAENGGELGEVNVGDYPESFEQAVFALNEAGERSDVVETEFGFHIIKLDSLVESTVTPFSEVAETLKQELLIDSATDLFFELQAQMERLAFEVPDTLEELASAVERPVFETTLFNASRYPSAVNYPQVENVAFSAELIDEGVNSELLQISDDKVMVVRVVEHLPERTKTLDEVREGIESNLSAEKAQQAALQWAQGLQTSLFADEDIQTMLDEKNVQWENVNGLSRSSNQVARELLDAIFALSADPANNSSVISMVNGNVGIVKLNGVTQTDTLTEDAISAAQQQFTAQSAQRTYQNFVDALRANADISFVN